MSLEKGSFDYDFQSFIEDVYEFNDIGDAAREVEGITLQDLKNQYKVVLEEVNELGDELEVNNPVKVLDGVVDSLVTILGMAKQLEELGFDVLGACQQVSFDNLQKFPSNEQVAFDSVEHYLKNGEDVYFEGVSLNQDDPDSNTVFVLLDNNNKIRKPVGFKGTDLMQYVPDNFKEFSV